MTKPSNISSIETGTGKNWSEWTSFFESVKAEKLSHLELSKKVEAELQGAVENPAWWAQSVTVAFEQTTGRRVPGQLANGLFELAVSKSVASPREELFTRAVEWFESQSTLNGKAYAKPRQTVTPKRSNWRCDFDDGSKFAVTVEDGAAKSKLVLSHTAVSTQADAERWKEFWSSVASSLAE